MSQAIDVAKVRAILLADGWHKIANNSFDIGPYEFARGSETVRNGNGPAPVGISFKDDAGYFLYGPMTAILATRTS